MMTPLHPALVGLFDIDWERFRYPHQKGEATDLLVGVTSSDPGTASAAMGGLNAMLIDQWSYEPYPSHGGHAAPCLPFLTGLVADPELATASELAELLYDLSASQINHPSQALRAALLAETETVAALVESGPSGITEWMVALAGNLGLVMWGVTVPGDDFTESYGTFTVPDVDVVPPGLIDPVGRTPGSPWARVPDDLRALEGAPARLASALRSVLGDPSRDPRLRRDALLAAALVEPRDLSWVGAHLCEQEPEDVREGALWVTAWKGLPWNEVATRTLIDGWGERVGYLKAEWFWESRDLFAEALAMREEPELHLLVLTELLARGREVLHVVPLLYDRHPRSRPALAKLVRATLAGPSPALADQASAVVRAVPGLTREGADPGPRKEGAPSSPAWPSATVAEHLGHREPGAFRGFRHVYEYQSIRFFTAWAVFHETGESASLMWSARNLWERQGPGPWLAEAAEVLAGTEHADEFLDLVRAVRAATPVLPLRGGDRTTTPAPDTCALLDRIIADLGAGP